MCVRFRMEEIRPDGEEEIVARVCRPNALTDRIERLVCEYEGDTQLTVYSGERDSITKLDHGDIECVSVIGGRTAVIDTRGETYFSRLRLYELEQRLPSCFVRINKSALANRNRIARFDATFNGAVNVTFRSGYTDYVSRRCFAELKRKIKG